DLCCFTFVFFFFSSRRRHTRFDCDWSSDVCSSDLRRPLFVEFNVAQSALTRGVCGGALCLNEDGTVTVPMGPGLGVSVDEEFVKIGRASCRERVWMSVGVGGVEQSSGRLTTGARRM